MKKWTRIADASFVALRSSLKRPSATVVHVFIARSTRASPPDGARAGSIQTRIAAPGAQCAARATPGVRIRSAATAKIRVTLQYQYVVSGFNAVRRVRL